MRRRLRIVVGLMAWTAVAAVTGWLVNDQADKALGQRVAPQLWRYASGSRSTVPLQLSDQLDLRGGDPIFFSHDDGRLVQIGEIRYTAGQQAPTALLYSSAPTPTSTNQLAWYSSPNSMAWIVSTLMPEAKQRQVSAQIRQAVEAHQESLLQSLQPLVESSLDQSLQIVESELPAAVEAHRAEIDRIGNRYQRQLIDKEVVPLVRREIWPIVRRRAKPIADQIGSDLWSRVSLWRFTWRYFYDKTPLLPNRGKFRDEFDRFVDKEATPVLASHSNEIVKVVERVIRDAAAHPEVQQAARRSGSKLLNDPELRSLLWKIVRHTAVDNPKFRQALKDTWTGAEARIVLARASRQFEPTVRRIAELLIGTPETGITPEFALVLRHQVLGKDRRWLVFESAADVPSSRPLGPDQPLTVVRGHRPGKHPFLAHLDSAGDPRQSTTQREPQR